MKKLIFALAIISMALACKKDDNCQPVTSYEYPYEQRLEGNWDLVGVEYDTELPDISGSGQTIPVSGSGTNVSGTFDLSRDPNNVDYNFSFTALADITGTGFPVPIPVNFSSTGEWTTTSDEKHLLITDDNGETLVFDVEENQEDTQIFTSTISENFQGIFTLEVFVRLSFERAD